MRKGMRVLLLALTIALCSATIATADLVSLQAVLDSKTVAPSPSPGKSSVNATTDFIADGTDAYWSITATGGSVSSIVIELAGFANRNEFGVFQGDLFVRLFTGGASAGSKALLSILEDGSVEVNFADTGVDFTGNVFGFYLKSPDGTFRSDTSMNGDGVDHMLAYQGKNIDHVKLPNLAAGLWTDNEYILAWEDLYGGGDRDYEDFVVMIESVTPVPVPEPGTLALLGAGLIGLGGMGLYRRRRN